MKKYEIMFILRPTLTEDEQTKALANLKNILSSDGSKIVEFKELGQRELAYEIKKFNSGFYCLTTVEAKDDSAIKEFDRIARISKDVIRHLVTKLEK